MTHHAATATCMIPAERKAERHRAQALSDILVLGDLEGECLGRPSAPGITLGGAGAIQGKFTAAEQWGGREAA